MEHNRAYKRKKDFAKAIRKKRLDREVTPYSDPESGMYKHLHQYSENKIHCSCPGCSAKTKNKGSRKKGARGYCPSYNPSMKDYKRNESMDYDEMDYQSSL